MKKTLSLVALICLLTSLTMAQGWVSFSQANPTEPNIELISSGNQQVNFSVNTSGMYSRLVTENSVAYQRISIPGYTVSQQIGEPEIPVIRQMIAIPECTSVQLQVSITSQSSYSAYNIYPTPSFSEVQHTDGSTTMEETFNIDNVVYSQNTLLPGMMGEIASIGYLRGQKYVEVYLYPVQFNPSEQSITVYTDLDITLSFTNPIGSVQANTGIFNNVATHTFLNYMTSGISAKVNDNVAGSGNVQWISLTDTAQAANIVADYLIICADAFFEPNNPNSEVLRIAQHRADYNGFDVAIVNATSIYADGLNFYYENYEYKTEQRIRTFIKRVYEGSHAQNTYDGKLGYVLLIGDTDNGNLGMPTSYEGYVVPFVGGVVASDYYFSCITNNNSVYDKVGDLYIGRFAVDNNLQNGLTELHNIVEKTINYESEYAIEPWRRNMFHLYGRLHPEMPPSEEEMYTMHEELVDGWMPDTDTMHLFNPYQTNSFYTPDKVVDSINDGVYYVSYIGHGGKNVWTNNEGINHYVNQDYLMQNLANSGKTPFVGAYACKTAWFDQNPDDECLAEALTTYSPDKGFVAYLGGTRSYLVSGGNDGEICELRFSIPQAIYQHHSHITGEFILEAKMGPLFSIYTRGIFNLLGDPALNIMATGYEITESTSLPNNCTISSEVTLKSGNTLTLSPSKHLHFEQNGKLNIEDGAYLTLQYNNTIHGMNPANEISIKGNIAVNGPSTFTSPVNHSWKGIVIDNATHEVNINNITFERSGISGSSGIYYTNLTNCNFTKKAKLGLTGAKIALDNVNFDSDGSATFTSGNKSAILNIINSNFENNQENALCIDGYANFLIDNCVFLNNGYQGIKLYNSGNNPFVSNRKITNCQFEGNGSNNQSAGIEIYGSSVDIETNNKIKNNQYGITSLNSSQVRIRGNSSATYISETQNITDNIKNQVYATANSFPYEMKWNAIIKDNNLYPLVYYSFTFGGATTLDVTNNYWGNNFSASTDLYPSSFYIYNPIWSLLPGKSGDEIESIYAEAKSLVSAEDFIGGKAKFEDLIEIHPTSSYALASMHDLLNIEENISSNYNDLQGYYYNNETIQGNENLKKLAGLLGNKCNIRMKDYPTAISWFEDIILNPETLADSVFAIIDLGHLYLQMDENDKYNGSLTQYVPTSKEEFYSERNKLISLLFAEDYTGIDEDDSIYNENQNNSNSISQNYPNPTNRSMNVSYNLTKRGIIKINIYDVSGRLIKSNNVSSQSTIGTNNANLNVADLDSGMYFYKLLIDNIAVDSKQMLIVK